MFTRSTDPSRATVAIFVDGREIRARATDSVAAAMLAHGMQTCRRSAVGGRPRGPYCMMGVCFDCLVVIDGTGSRQGCMTRVREGMRIESQDGKRELGC